MKTFSDAIILATMKHYGQFDKAGQPYILHPIRVMQKAETDDERMVAMLHDVVEDTDMTLEGLRKLGFSEKVVIAIDHLTRRKGELYDEFIDRVMLNELAAQVKIWDLEDNMNLSRLNEVMERDWSRMNKYSAAMFKLTKGERYI